MEEIRKCKVLDVREFRRNDDYLYHIILKDLDTNERFDLKIDNFDRTEYKNRYDVDVDGYELLVRDDVISMMYNDEFFTTIIFEIL